MAAPRTRFVDRDLDRDIMFMTDWGSCIDLMWEQPATERFLLRLAKLGRVLLFHKPGTGGSDDPPLTGGVFSAELGWTP